MKWTEIDIGVKARRAGSEMIEAVRVKTTTNQILVRLMAMFMTVRTAQKLYATKIKTKIMSWTLGGQDHGW